MQDKMSTNLILKDLKGWFTFFVVFFFTVVSTIAQNSGNVRVIDNSFVLNNGNGFQIKIAVAYNLSVNKNYKIVLKLPNNIEYNPSQLPFNSSNPVKGFEVDETQVGFKTIKYELDNIRLTNDNEEYSITFDFTGFVNRTIPNCSTDVESTIEFMLEAQATSCNSNCATVQLGSGNSVIRTNKQSDNLSVDWRNELSYPTSTDNRFVPVINSYYFTSGIDYGNKTVTINYPKDLLQYLTAEIYDNNNFNKEPISIGGTISTGISNFNPDGTTGTITFNMLGGGYWVRIYYKPLVNSAPNTTTVINIESTIQGSGRKCDNSIVLLNEPKTGSINQSLVTGATATSNINPIIEALYVRDETKCFTNCDFNNNFSEIRFEANAVYTAANSTPPQRIRIDVPVTQNDDGTVVSNGVQIQRIELSNPSQFNTDGPRIFYQTFVGQKGPFLKQGNVYTINRSDIKYIFIEGLNIAGNDNDFQLFYKFEGGAQQVRRTFLFSYLTNTDDNSSVARVPITINDIKICDNRSYVRDYFRPNTFKPKEAGLVFLELRPFGSRDAKDKYTFDFEYVLNPNMVFNGTSLRFALAPETIDPTVSPTVSQYSSRITLNQDWKIAPDGYIKIENGKLKVKGLSFKNTCASISRCLSILASVSILDKVPQGPFYSTFLGDVAYGLDNWTVLGSAKLKLDTYLSCNGQDYTGGNIKSGDKVKIRYYLKNLDVQPQKAFMINSRVLKFAQQPLRPITIKGFIQNPKGEKTQLIQSSEITPTYTNNDQNVKLDVKGDITLLGFHDMVIELEYQIESNISLGSSFVLEKDIASSNLSTEVESGSITLTVSTSSLCGEVSCSECVTSFSPVPGEKYLLSAWVKESFTGILPQAYLNSGIRITFNNGSVSPTDLFRPAGPVIDGWQRIERSFQVPLDAKNIQIQLVSENKDVDAYFDDIRVHPFRSNMKSFVYDPSSQRLVAELDENNYATLYEYDDEGILIRVKKETERGVMTIKESRNNQSKIFKNAE